MRKGTVSAADRKRLEAAKELSLAREDVERLEQRRAELVERPVLNEARKLRFIRRLDQDLEQARARLFKAEANAEALRHGV